MSLQVVSVKEEPGWIGNYETDLGSEEETDSKPTLLKDGIKEDEDWDAVCNAAHTELYNDHQIKDELVLGPEIFYPLDKAQVAQKSVDEFWKKASKKSPEQIREESTETGCGEPSLFTHRELSKTTQALPLGDCFVKLERLPLHSVKKASSKFSHIEAVLKSKKKKKIACKKKIFICDTCGKQFKEKMSLVHHVQIHMRGKPYACDICQKTFACKKYLRRHILVHKYKPFSCNVWNTKFPYMSSLINHKKDHTELTKDKYRKILVSFQCEICQAKCTTKGSLNRHKRSHMKEKPFSCAFCKRQFSRKDSLICHEHTHIKDKTSETRGKQFSSNSYYKKKLKVHSCEICEKKFTTTTRLAIHKRIHTGEKPYACEICDKSFRHQSTLTSHLRGHTGQKPYACDMCESRYITSSNLRQHKRSAHFLYKKTLKVDSCEICEETFTTTIGLNIHKRIHTGEKPYACEICDKSFRHQSTLTSHMRGHTGQKPYACDMCESRYITSSKLRQHKRSAHFLV